MHCCEEMSRALAGNDVAIEYNPRFREYGISIMDGGSSVLLARFCPWCGTKLADSLRERWFDRLDELGLEPEDEAVPKEMMSDQWWRHGGA